MAKESNDDSGVDPEVFLEDLIKDPIDFSEFKTEDGSDFVYSSIDLALDRLRPRDAEKYVPRLKMVGYDVKWVAPAVIESIN